MAGSMNVELRPAPSRITVTGQVSHQPKDGEPITIPTPYVLLLESEGEAWPGQTKKIGETPVTVDKGWVDNPGLVLVQNVEGKRLDRQPSEKERKDMASRVILVHYDGSTEGCEVAPGRSLPFFPSDFSKLRLRCLNGEAKCRVIVFPK